MNILTQSLIEFQKELSIDSSLYQEISKLISTVYQNPNIDNYVKLVQETDKELKNKALTLIKKVFETADYIFRHSKERRQSYYVKQTRNRTIITVFGDLTYCRTEYRDRRNKTPFCYVDWKFGIGKWERYDSCIQAMIVDAYADSNSMIKVGKIIGDRISGSFNTTVKNTAIHRQTVQNILLRYPNLDSEITKAAYTPSTLYIMADEKFIPIQGQPDPPNREMIKMAIIFEGIQAIKRKDGSLTKRKRILNKTIVANTNNDFWDSVIDTLYKKYDMEKVENIYLMGDGASWIKTGVDLLKYPTNNVTFGIDSFHFNQAIKKISPNKPVCDILRNYARHNLKDEFQYVVDSIIDNSLEKDETIQKNLSYIKNQWDYYQISVNQIEVGCPMEQAIAHILSSVFTNVAKAYSRNHLHTYLNNRILYQNNHDIRSVVLSKIYEETNYNNEFDFSIFEHKIQPTNPTIQEFNKNIITKF